MLDFLRACWGRFQEDVPLCNSVYPKMWLRHFSQEGLQFDFIYQRRSCYAYLVFTTFGKLVKHASLTNKKDKILPAANYLAFIWCFARCKLPSTGKPNLARKNPAWNVIPQNSNPRTFSVQIVIRIEVCLFSNANAVGRRRMMEAFPLNWWTRHLCIFLTAHHCICTRTCVEMLFFCVLSKTGKVKSYFWSKRIISEVVQTFSQNHWNK